MPRSSAAEEPRPSTAPPSACGPPKKQSHYRDYGTAKRPRPDELLTFSEACAHLRVGKTTLRDYIANGLIRPPIASVRRACGSIRATWTSWSHDGPATGRNDRRC